MAAEGSAEGGNWFQRQKELKGWSQPAVENVHAFVLGGGCCVSVPPRQLALHNRCAAGGLGTTISMDLCRLGVRKITLLDYDVVGEDAPGSGCSVAVLHQVTDAAQMITT